MLTIRFSRQGRKGVPFYHIVLAEKTKAVQKKFIAQLGTFDPEFNAGKGKMTLEAEKAKYYIEHGAQVSQSAARAMVKHGFKEAGKFVKARASKPKKEAPKATEKASE